MVCDLCKFRKCSRGCRCACHEDHDGGGPSPVGAQLSKPLLVNDSDERAPLRLYAQACGRGLLPAHCTKACA